jgi:hypothetical protein
MNKKLKIAQFGLGPIGVATLKLAASKPWAQVIGGIDIDPAKAGRDLGDLTGVRGLRSLAVYQSIEQLFAHGKPDIIFHTAVSRFRAAYPQLEEIARHGISVVSSCEELLFPQLRKPALARRLDGICRRTGARIVAAGVNPGFVMDVLPLCLSGVSCNVRAVHVQRVVNASTRRGPLQRKIGSGLPPEEFRRRLRQGKVGHAGLRESLALIAHTLGWKTQRITERGDAVLAERAIHTSYVAVKKGLTCGLHQRAEAKVNGRIVLTLDLKMYLDAADPHDAIQIVGDPPIELRINCGVAGDQATAGALVNTARRLLSAMPGLLLVTDLPLPHLD